MKMIRLFCFFFLSSFLFTSCKKNEQTPDYRDEFVGDYDIEFRSITMSLVFQQPNDTSYYSYQGSISKTGGDHLMIEFGGIKKSVRVHANGVLDFCEYPNVGAITTSDLIFEYNNHLCANGPLGSISFYTVAGIKQ